MHCTWINRCMSFASGALYRLVYDDSYTNDYAVLRALKSFGEKKYDVFEQNCEHSTRWCKTGIHDSIQMEVCFTTLGKIAVIVLLRLISLIMLWLLQLSHESQPQSERSREQERLINAVYMAFIAFVFFVYSLYQLQTDLAEGDRETSRYGSMRDRSWTTLVCRCHTQALLLRCPELQRCCPVSMLCFLRPLQYDRCLLLRLP